MMANEWFEVEIKASPALLDAISNHLFEIGALGVTEAGSTDHPVLIAYFDLFQEEKVKPQVETFCESLRALFPQETKPSISYKKLKDAGWSEKYKEFYKAQKLSHEFFLLPAWDKTTPVPREMTVIRMEPGQAFGTGLHPSTKLSLRLIEYVFEKAFRPQDLTVIDVGTGSGILAIASEKLGASKIEGIDIDPIAVETAIENCAINKCKEIRMSTDPFQSFQEPFDLVISNILLEAHRQLAPDYKRLTKKDGYLIVSGLLGNQRQETVELLSSYGFGLLISEAFQEWAAFLFARKD